MLQLKFFGIVIVNVFSIFVLPMSSCFKDLLPVRKL